MLPVRRIESHSAKVKSSSCTIVNLSVWLSRLNFSGWKDWLPSEELGPITGLPSSST